MEKARRQIWKVYRLERRNFSTIRFHMWPISSHVSLFGYKLSVVNTEASQFSKPTVMKLSNILFSVLCGAEVLAARTCHTHRTVYMSKWGHRTRGVNQNRINIACPRGFYRKYGNKCSRMFRYIRGFATKPMLAKIRSE